MLHHRLGHLACVVSGQDAEKGVVALQAAQFLLDLLIHLRAGRPEESDPAEFRVDHLEGRCRSHAVVCIIPSLSGRFGMFLSSGGLSVFQNRRPPTG